MVTTASPSLYTRIRTMQLLVSVGTPQEAETALQGGADLIDAKDAIRGALGPVSLETFGEIHDQVGGQRRVSAALGDAADEAAIEQLAHDFADAGAAFVKVGFAGISSASTARALADATARGARSGQGGTGVVAVAYADAESVGSLEPDDIGRIAVEVGVDGLLIDTADKNGPGLAGLIEADVLARWVGKAHEGGLFVALAGKLTSDDLAFVRNTGADIAGVRGAACEGGRIGRVVVDRVRMLRERCDSSVGR